MLYNSYFTKREAAEPNEPKNGGRDAKPRNLQMVTVAY